jgi:uncharacterized protein YciI
MSLPPICHEVTVAADPAQAFTVFSEDISAWWPMDRMSVLGGASLVSFEANRLVEANVDGEEAVWAEAQSSEPGESLRLSWHAGTDTVSTVAVSFRAVAGGAQVALEHSDWETFSDPDGARAQYDQAWPIVLAAYAAQFSAPVGPQDTWVALMHVPGPAAPTDSSVFADPRFAEHMAFLERMNARGYLVAAGPLGSDGSGMTILRLPGDSGLAEAATLATTDDAAVAGGLLAVSVRPWNVILHALGSV